MPVLSEKTRSINAWNQMRGRLTESASRSNKRQIALDIANLKEKLEELYSFDAYDNTPDYTYPGYDAIEEDAVQSGRKAWQKLMHEKKCLSMLQEERTISKLVSKVMADVDKIETIKDAEKVFVNLISLHKSMKKIWPGENDENKVNFSNTFVGKWTAAKNLFNDIKDQIHPDIVKQFEEVVEENDDIHQVTDKLHADHKESYNEFSNIIGNLFGNYLSTTDVGDLIQHIKNSDELFIHFLKGVRTGFRDAVEPDIDKSSIPNFISSIGQHVGYHSYDDMEDIENNVVIKSVSPTDATAEYDSAGSQTMSSPSSTLRDKFLDVTGLSSSGQDEKPYEMDILRSGIIRGIRERIVKKRSSDATDKHKVI